MTRQTNQYYLKPHSKPDFPLFKGPLPSTFSKLDSLEDISLARNDFSGDLSVLGNTNLLICTVRCPNACNSAFCSMVHV